MPLPDDGHVRELLSEPGVLDGDGSLDREEAQELAFEREEPAGRAVGNPEDPDHLLASLQGGRQVGPHITFFDAGALQPLLSK